jgi:hypothetical protein
MVVLPKQTIFMCELFLNYSELNKLFCTFCIPDQLEDTIKLIDKRYNIIYNKIFILESPQTNELICTYNIDMGNVSSIPMPNTITMHRKKESNTLYTINALNALIRQLNHGHLDTSYRVTWGDYRNTVLLTHESSELKRLDTKIHRIIDLA